MNEAHQALRACARVYAKCSSYSDKGAVRSRVVDDQGNVQWEDDIRFRTAFVRNDRFRFEFFKRSPGKRKPSRTLIWFDGNEAKWWWSLAPKQVDISDLSFAIASGTGVSQGTAHTIPRLLLPRLVSGTNMTRHKNVSLLDRSDIDGTSCLRISYKDSYEIELQEEELAYYQENELPLPDPTMTIDEVYWIDSATFVLRRLDDMKDGSAESRTDYYPSLNQPIPESALVFDPDIE